MTHCAKKLSVFLAVSAISLLSSSSLMAQEVRNYRLLPLSVEEARRQAPGMSQSRPVAVYIGSNIRVSARATDAIGAMKPEDRPAVFILSSSKVYETMEVYWSGSRCVRSNAVNMDNVKTMLNLMLVYCSSRWIQVPLDQMLARAERTAQLDAEYRQLLFERARLEGRGLNAEERRELSTDRNADASAAKARELRQKSDENRRFTQQVLSEIPGAVAD